MFMLRIWPIVVSLLTFVELGDSVSSLQSVFDKYYQWRLKDSPQTATYINVHDYDDQLDKYGLGHMDFTKAKVDEFLKSLGQIDYRSLTRNEQTNYAALNDTLTTLSGAYQWRLYSGLNPINFLEGGQVDPGFALQITPFKTKKDFENFIARLNGSPQQIDDQITLMKEAIRLARTNNKYSMKHNPLDVKRQNQDENNMNGSLQNSDDTRTKVPGQIGDMIKDNATDFIFYRPFATDLDRLSISDTDKNDLRKQGLIASAKYIETLRKLKHFIENDYMTHSRGSYGVGGFNQGGNFYINCLKWHLTTDLSPGRVHQIGLEEVTRISKIMIQIMRRQNFNGTIAEYFTMLSKDPKFHFKTGDEIVEKYRDIIYNRIYPALPKVFKDLPKYKIKVGTMANDGVPVQYQVGSSDGTRPGEIQANVHRPNETDSFSMVGLALHEAVPGHHLQFTKLQTTSLPKFRQEDIMGARYSVPYSFQGYQAYVEGWALYAEFLGEELGIYVDDYELMGRYSNEIVRACRLVADTGLHFFGWSRDQALKYFQQYSAWPGGNLENEVDRYITWPGQACAYKIGEMKIRELREKAEHTLGSKFDIKDFHDVVLTTGPVPLPLLESIVNDWISDTLGAHNTNPIIPPHTQTQKLQVTRTMPVSTHGPVFTFSGHLPLRPNIG